MRGHYESQEHSHVDEGRVDAHQSVSLPFQKIVMNGSVSRNLLG